VTLTESPADTSFGGWSENCGGYDPATKIYTPDTSSTCTVTLDSNYTVGVIFNGLSLSCSAVTSGNVGVPFNSGAITVSGGTAPYTFSIVGTLPAGLTLNTLTGAVTGTPTATGSFSIKVTDANSTTATSLCSITIS
jgi:hypothetical protein